MKSSTFWQQTVYLFTAIASGLFVILTALAMLIYPGGTVADPATRGYSFFTNFFSDLGLTVAHNGQPNPIAGLLFPIALTLAGLALALFFVAFIRFFTQSRLSLILGVIGTLLGVVAGGCFIGVAFTPADIFREAHGQFVLNAFQAFLFAVAIYVVVMLRDRTYPKRYALIFILFAVLLGVYLVLITQGPDMDTAQGLLMQATGQKIIVYASILSVLAQSLAALRVIRARPAA